jgi:hypothetical protein
VAGGISGLPRSAITCLRGHGVGEGDGELRPWHYIYVYSIESRLMMRVSLPRSAITCLEGNTVTGFNDSTQGPSWGHLKSQLSSDLVDFWRYIPTKWLQERAKGSKNEPGMPPLRAFCGLPESQGQNLAMTVLLYVPSSLELMARSTVMQVRFEG